MNQKRVTISLGVALLCGIFCAMGTMYAQIPGLVITAGLLASTIYNRMLIGLVIGLSGDLEVVRDRKLNPVVRGALFGLVVTFEMALYNLENSAVLLGFGVLYGIVIDFAATRYGK